MAAAARLFPLDALLRFWRRRLGELHQYIADACGHDRWLAEIRTRVYAFLVSRYSDSDTPLTGDIDAPDIPPAAPAEPFCIVTPENHPPRRSRHLRRTLTDLREQNRRARPPRPRWRWWP